MWDKVKSLLSDETTQPAALADGQNLRIATAALLVHAAFADDEYQAEEHAVLERILREKFDLDETDSHNLIASAQREFVDSVDLYSFVRVINENFDNNGRQDVVKHLWEIILADGVIDNYEDNLMGKVCGLLGVSPRDKALIKQQVESRQ